MNLNFSINDFDSDGDICEEGIFIHFESSRILVAKNIKEYKAFVKKLTDMKPEIESLL